MYKYSLIVSLVLSGSALAHAEPGPWKEISNSQGITVETRTVTDSKMDEFRGTAVIQAPLARILAIFNDGEHKKEWMQGAAGERRLAGTDEDMYLYQGVTAPLVSNRDVVVRVQIKTKPKEHTVEIRFESVTSIPKGTIPPVPAGVVRMPFLRGHWLLAPTHGGQWTRAVYQVHSDPGGNLGSTVSNMASKTILSETLLGLQKQVTSRAYPAFEERLQNSSEYKQLIDVP